MIQVGNLARTTGDPRLFVTSAIGCLMTTESQDVILTSHLKDGISCSTVSPGHIFRPEGRSLPADHDQDHFQQQLSFPWRSPTQVLTTPTPAQLQWLQRQVTAGQADIWRTANETRLISAGVKSFLRQLFDEEVNII